MLVKRIVLVGEAPNGRADPEKHLPLHPLPRHLTGGRLFSLTGLTDVDDYYRLFQRVNVFHSNPGGSNGKRSKDRWPARDASLAAKAMLPFLSQRTVVFVGRRPAAAFGHKDLPFFWWYDYPTSPPWEDRPGSGMRCAVIPHTSPRSHFYNKEENKELTRRFFSALLSIHREDSSCLLPLSEV